jgi:hypothetical protein
LDESYSFIWQPQVLMCSFLPICVVARKKVNAKKKDAHFILVGPEVPAVDRLREDL